jgi:peptidoglycan/LPS O-acetylase OafA/YrhL
MHRSDIDGLRTIAVLPVIAFHFKILEHLMVGGFIGVDVFFVISGYLITRNIYNDVINGKYSIADFYNRRIRRIFPALYALYGFCIIVVFFLSFAAEAEAVGRSMISSIFFTSNIVFYNKSGYFFRGGESNPLLHTWSLSVEEQFYIVFPIVIYFIRNFNDKVKLATIFMIALSSFAFGLWIVSRNAAAAFYLVQFRAWELLIGSLLAIGAVPKLVHRWQAELTGAGGLALIAASTILISKTTSFPGAAALAPCLGTAAVIHSGAATTTLVGRLLAFSPIRFIGLISYSLYLWHWPVIVFYRLYLHEPNRIEKLVLVALCVLLAAISWRFIERPFRTKPYRLGAFGTLVAGGGAMITIAVIAIAVSPMIDKAWPYPTRATEILSYAKIDESHMRTGSCFSLPDEGFDYEFHYRKECLGLKAHALNVLIVGDSHAAHLWFGLQTAFPTVNFLQATVTGCAPIIGNKSADAVCSAMMKYVYEELLPNAGLDGIVIAARWQPQTIQEGIETARAFLPYAGKVYLFGPIPEYDQALPRILARAVASGNSDSKFAARHQRAAPLEIDRTLSAALQGGAVQYISIYRALCNPECELWAAKDVPMQFDYSHLTREGSIALARRLGPQLFPISSEPSEFRAIRR